MLEHGGGPGAVPRSRRPRLGSQALLLPVSDDGSRQFGLAPGSMEFILSINRVLACVGRHAFAWRRMRATKTPVLATLWGLLSLRATPLTPELDASP